MKLSLFNKLTMYKSIICPTWLYGIQLWEPTKPSNTKTLQAFQSICLRLIISVPWYVINKNIHKDLNMSILNDLVKYHYKKFQLMFHTHSNLLIKSVPSVSIFPRTLKRQWPRELINAYNV